MPISTPVPQEYASKFDAKTPSTYDQYVVFTGPYMYKNDSSGKLVGRTPGKSIELIRTPTGTPRPTTALPTWTRSRSRRATTSAVSSSRRILKGQSLSRATAPPGARDQAGRLAQ
jgi:peptide/nickel transport system substrate-binding protein